MHSSAVASVRETGKLLRALRAMYSSAVASVRETGKLLRALRVMHSSAVASVRTDAGCTTEDSFCPVRLKLEWCRCSPVLFLVSVVCAQNDSQHRRHGQRVHGQLLHSGARLRRPPAFLTTQPLDLLRLLRSGDPVLFVSCVLYARVEGIRSCVLCARV